MENIIVTLCFLLGTYGIYIGVVDPHLRSTNNLALFTISVGLLITSLSNLYIRWKQKLWKS